ncbi:MAG: hypothetical protein ISQ07_12975 [Pirellulales bacterium]|nr:hypothetical protein [Pirellulales bacterium]
MAEADFLFAFDTRIDQPVCPVDMPGDRRKRFAKAAMAALEGVFSQAISRKARGVVLFGDLFDPSCTSPAQAADIADQIDTFAGGSRLVVVTAADAEAAAAVATALGEPPGLHLLTPDAPVIVQMGPLSVEFTCEDPRDVHITTRLVATHVAAPEPHAATLDGDREHAADEAFDTATQPHEQTVAHATVRGQRDRPRPALTDITAAHTVWTLPSLQPRNHYEHGPGAAACLTISSEGRLHRWEVFATAAVSWQIVRTVCSAHEQEEELSATAAAEVEQAVATCDTPFSVVRLLVDCEGDADRRSRVSRMAPAVLAEMRQMLESLPSDPTRPLAWCEHVEADPDESLEAVAAADEIGSSRRFPAMLAEEAISWPLASAGDERVEPAAVVREAAWMTLELLEDD